MEFEIFYKGGINRPALIFDKEKVIEITVDCRRNYGYPEPIAKLIVAAPSLFEAVNALYVNLAVIMDQIDSCAPTEMIGAAFDGRELASARELIRKYHLLVYGK